jgi:hypothetical protein
MIVPHTFPDSRETVENSAAPKASTNPTMANRKRTQTCESPIRNNPGEDELGALLGITIFSNLRKFSGQHTTVRSR